jgi:type II secretory pathway pseudopilin PulG
MTRATFRRKASAFALLEVMIALTIFAIAAFSLVLALDASITAGGERNEIEAATRGLSNQLALLRAERVLPQDDDLPDDHSGILYHLNVVPAPMQNIKHQPVTGYYRATVTAKWSVGSRNEERSVEELLYQP